MIYTINSARSRFQIIADYAARHDLSAKQVDELVRQLPDYGVRSMLFASLVVLARPDNVVSLSDHRRDLLRDNSTGVGAWQGPGNVA